MKHWYYHGAAEGRVGPLSAEDLRARFRDRRIQGDTLVWREGLREWTALAQVAGEIDLAAVTPDLSRPPPLPPPRPAPAPAMPAGTRISAPRAPTGESKRMSGCLIALIVCAVAAVPLIGILAAIAIPAYQDYVARAKQAAPAGFDATRLAAADAQVRTLLVRAMSAYYAQSRQCPDTFEFESLQVRDAGLAGYYTVDLAAAGDGRCGYRVTFLQQGPALDGRPFRYVAEPTPGGATVTCSAPDVPAGFHPPNCD